MDNYYKDKANNGLEEWLPISEPVIKSDSSNSESADKVDEQKEVIRKKRVAAPMLTFQLIICLLFLTFIYVCKTFWYDTVYQKFKTIYDREVMSSMYFSGDFNDLDYSVFFEASFDEV